MTTSDKTDQPVIRVEGVSKHFKLYRRPLNRLLDVYWPRTRGRFTEVSALQDITFSVKKGECFGIIGENGSGKSTLLKLLTGTLMPSVGKIGIDGRVLAILELGGGINPELTGRENVLASAKLLNLPDRDIAAKAAEIEQFAEIGEFFDMPMKIYSSGMYVRVAFSIYVFMNPDILIVDEALSVGDVFFQQKCFDALERMMARGTTVLFVSHDSSAVQRLCNRALLLEHGRMAFLGGPSEALNRYHGNLGKADIGAAAAEEFNRTGAPPLTEPPALPELIEAVSRHDLLSSTRIENEAACIKGTYFSDPHGEPVSSRRVGESVCLSVLLEAKTYLAVLDASYAIFDRFGDLICSTSSGRINETAEGADAGDNVVITFDIKLEIPPGAYTFKVGFATSAETPLDEFVQSEMIGPIHVYWDEDLQPFYGKIRMPVRGFSALMPGRASETEHDS